MKYPKDGRTPKDKGRRRVITGGVSHFEPKKGDLAMGVTDPQASAPKHVQAKPWTSFFLSDELPASGDFSRGDQGLPQERESFD